jgi:hypothetical protein
MQKIYSISIVNTQMQLINCMEAVQSYSCNSNWLINGNLSQNRNEQIDLFYKNHNLSNYFDHYINLRMLKSHWLFCTWINMLLAKIILASVLMIRKMDFVFIGHYLNPIHRYLIRQSNKKNSRCKNILVDDGTGTMLFANERYKEEQSQVDCCFYDRSMRLLFSPGSKEMIAPKKLEYYTIYPIQNILSKDSIKSNNYDVIRSWDNSFDLEIKPNTMIVVGQTLVEENIVSIQKYRDLLSEAFHRAEKIYGIEMFIYCPHPGESNIEDKLSIFENIIVHKNKDPFELFALTFPKSCIIIGFFSSSLWNLTYLGIDASIKYIRIDKNDIICGEPMLSHIINIYQTYNNSNVIKQI